MCWDLLQNGDVWGLIRVLNPVAYCFLYYWCVPWVMGMGTQTRHLVQCVRGKFYRIFIASCRVAYENSNTLGTASESHRSILSQGFRLNVKLRNSPAAYPAPPPNPTFAGQILRYHNSHTMTTPASRKPCQRPYHVALPRSRPRCW